MDEKTKQELTLLLIYQVPGGKSLVLTDEGKQKAEELRRKYL